MSTTLGFRYLYAADYIDREMDAWFHVSYLEQSEFHVLTLLSRSGISTMWSISKSSLRKRLGLLLQLTRMRILRTRSSSPYADKMSLT